MLRRPDGEDFGRRADVLHASLSVEEQTIRCCPADDLAPFPPIQRADVGEQLAVFARKDECPKRAGHYL